METSANIPTKCFSINPVDDYSINIEDQCVFQESNEKWLELEQFWGDPRHRLQEFDSQPQQLSSSLERHLLYDECLQEPDDEVPEEYKDDTCFLEDLSSVIRGDDIKDIPTQYSINGFKPSELVVIGTYVDKRIIPGFKYKVRKNRSEKYLFHGKALRLQQIGLGYGKRLTFESNSLNHNKNYFWSDSCPTGFGFTLCAINPGDVFAIHDPVSRDYCGRAVITEVKGPQVVESVVLGANGRVEKSVAVDFSCNITIGDSGNGQTLAVQDYHASGTVLLVKKSPSALAEVENIQLADFVVKDCLLKPEN